MKKGYMYLVVACIYGHGYTEGETIVELLPGDEPEEGGCYLVTAGPDDDMNFLLHPDEVVEIGEI